jgi:hypothetical protein
MPQNKLHKSLERLRDEVNHLAADDIESRERLNNLITDLEVKLARPEDEDEGLMDNLKESIQHFEAEHPRATAILNDIMVTLSNMGI